MANPRLPIHDKLKGKVIEPSLAGHLMADRFVGSAELACAIPPRAYIIAYSA
jgi:hypothetical protein